MRGKLFVPAVLLVAALAGCTGGGGSADVAPPGVCPDGECAEGDTGIRGNVLDAEGLPVAGASVAVQEAELEATTGPAGDFAFFGLEPGEYTLYALKLGFTQGAKRVTVEEGSVVSVELVVETIAIQEPYVDVIGPAAGHFLCSMYVPAYGIINCNVADALGEDQQVVTFELSSPDLWQTIVGEMRWEQGTAATSNRLANYISYEGRAGNHWWCEADGETPIVFQYEREGDSVCTSQGSTDPEPHDTDEVETLFIAADSGFGGLSTDNPPWRVAYDQRYELMVSIFYVEPAPAGYSALPDA